MNKLKESLQLLKFALYIVFYRVILLAQKVKYSAPVQKIGLAIGRGSKFLAKFGIPGLILLYIIKILLCFFTGICII